jgi:hypothetical protein
MFDHGQPLLMWLYLNDITDHVQLMDGHGELMVNKWLTMVMANH